jgi:hypothetical protein
MLLIGGAAQSPEGAALVQNGDVTITGELSLKAEAQYLHRVFPEIGRDLRNALPWRLCSGVRIALTSNPELFEQITGSPWISAFAVPSEQFVAMVVQPGRTTSATLRGTLTHELCHLLLHENIEDSVLPRWLDEGVCQWVSGSLGEILSGAAVNRNDLEIGRQAIPLGELAERFPREGEALLLAYAESRSFVEYLVQRSGVEGLHGVLHRLSEGTAVDEAVKVSFGSSLDRLEAEWLQSLQGRWAWLSWFGRHFYDLLFFTMALLAVLAAVRLLVKRRARLAEMEEE